MNTSSDAKECAVLDIGSRLELFVDDYLIDSFRGTRLELHPPVPQEIALQYDAPWEGASSNYVTVMQESRHPYRRGIQARKGIEF